MDYIFILSVAVLVTYYCFTGVQFFSFFSIEKNTEAALEHYPQVSVLIAARNEEENIERCLLALSKQHYPLDHIQILVGDDSSDDQTAAVVLAFKRNHPEVNLNVQAIKSPTTALKGKANVLAQLFHLAEGELVFITDADIAVSPEWIKGLVHVMQTHPVDAASGSTFVEADNVFGTFQALEWIEAFGLLHAADHYHIAVTAVGNNMVVRKTAYDAVGGYESIPFSVTEDLELFLALQKNNSPHKQVLSSDVIAWTRPIDSFLTLLKQRKRWLKGVERTPWICKLYMVIHALLGFFIAGAFVYDIGLGCFLYAFSVLVHVVRIAWITHAVKVDFNPKWIIYILLIDGYQLIFSCSILVYYLLPVGVEWKKRVY